MTIKYKNINLYFTDEGNGEAVVLLHGFLENSTMWTNLVPEISKNHRVVTIDLLGHGQTDSIGYIHTMEMMAEAVKAVLEHLQIEQAKFVGHSMGGYVALAYAESYISNVTGLCLMNSTAQEDSDERKLNRDRAIKAVKQNYRAFVSMSVANLFAPENREALKEAIDFVKEQALETSLQGIVAALEGMKTRKDRTSFFKTLPINKMLIVGRKDPVLEFNTTVSHVEHSDVKIVEFPDGHMSHIENTKELTYNILRFIEK